MVRSAKKKASSPTRDTLYNCLTRTTRKNSSHQPHLSHGPLVLNQISFSTFNFVKHNLTLLPGSCNAQATSRFVAPCTVTKAQANWVRKLMHPVNRIIE